MDKVSSLKRKEFHMKIVMEDSLIKTYGNIKIIIRRIMGNMWRLVRGKLWEGAPISNWI